MHSICASLNFASVAGRATRTQCRGRKRTQYHSAKLTGGRRTKRTRAALDDGNALTHGVEKKKMLQSNSELQAMVATQQEQILHLKDQLDLSDKQTASLANKLSETLKVLTQVHSQLMLHGTANRNQ